jgi:hypothetical protein
VGAGPPGGVATQPPCSTGSVRRTDGCADSIHFQEATARVPAQLQCVQTPRGVEDHTRTFPRELESVRGAALRHLDTLERSCAKLLSREAGSLDRFNYELQCTGGRPLTCTRAHVATQASLQGNKNRCRQQEFMS